MCARTKKNICDTPDSEAAKSKEKKYVETPLMKQYYKIKAVHPDAILLFRVGDFYETFGEDAIKASGRRSLSIGVSLAMSRCPKICFAGSIPPSRELPSVYIW